MRSTNTQSAANTRQAVDVRCVSMQGALSVPWWRVACKICGAFRARFAGASPAALALGCLCTHQSWRRCRYRARSGIAPQNNRSCGLCHGVHLPALQTAAARRAPRLHPGHRAGGRPAPQHQTPVPHPRQLEAAAAHAAGCGRSRRQLHPVRQPAQPASRAVSLKVCSVPAACIRIAAEGSAVHLKRAAVGCQRRGSRSGVPRWLQLIHGTPRREAEKGSRIYAAALKTPATSRRKGR